MQVRDGARFIVSMAPSRDAPGALASSPVSPPMGHQAVHATSNTLSPCSRGHEGCAGDNEASAAEVQGAPPAVHDSFNCKHRHLENCEAAAQR